MLNKLKFNNLIISNKSKIRQGRIQTINKFVQKIRNIKKQVEKYSDNENKRNRLRKVTESLEYLKTLKCVDIVKKILLLDKDPSAIITNGLSAPEEIAIAWLASNKIIMELIKCIRLELALFDSEPQWKQELIKISKRREKINKTEEKKQKRIYIKKQKEIARKRLEWINENNPQIISQQSDVSDCDQFATIDGWKVETLHAGYGTQICPKTKTNEINHMDTERNERKKVKLENSNESDFKATKNLQHTQHCKSSSILSKTKKDNDEKKNLAVTRVVDPFFITETGDNYLATVVTSRGQQNSMSPDNYKKEKSAKKLNEFNYNKKTEKSSFQDTLNSSWKVNQKVKPNISGLQGKKIIFEDNDKIESVDNCKNNFQDTTFHNENPGNIKRTTNSESINLHPSWAAKQKFKPVIKAFQGKKITFE